MSLGLARTAEVKRDARIGEAEAKADAQIKEAVAEEQRMAAQLTNDILIAQAKRDFEVKKAAYDQEVNAKVRHSIRYQLWGKGVDSLHFHRKLKLNWLSNCKLPKSNRS